MIGEVMDCKHEKGLEAYATDVYDIRFHCSRGCGDFIVDPDQVVILTKAQHQLIQDAIKAGKILTNRTLPYEDESGVIQISLAHWANFKSAINAVDEREE